MKWVPVGDLYTYAFGMDGCAQYNSTTTVCMVKCLRNVLRVELKYIITKSAMITST